LTPSPPPASVFAVVQYLRTQLRKSRGELGANLLVGGYDVSTSHAVLVALHPNGSMDVVAYSALGSGGLAAMGVLESRYHRHYSSSSPLEGASSKMTVVEGVRLAIDAVRAGIDNDLGSGSQVDVCIIGRGGTFYRRAKAREEELRWTRVDGKRNADDVDDDGGSMAFEGAEDPNIPQISSLGNTVAGRRIGVNGLGNVPFAVQSRKVVCGGRSDAERKSSRSWLDDVLTRN